jgi:nucleoside-diphosphate-sugar epimerase
VNVFLAGGTGVVGRQLVPLLVASGHRVTGLTRTEEGAAALAALGATPIVGDVFDAARLETAIASCEPEVVIHQLTAFGPGTPAGTDTLQATIRVRTEGTRGLLAAARRAGALRFVAQSISFVCRPVASGLTDEATPLHLEAPETMQPLVRSIAELESQVTDADGLDGVVLRYGWFYGPGTFFAPGGTIPRAIRAGRMPIIGEGRGTYSLIHVRDAALATVAALTRATPGVYNVVDDQPVALATWLPIVAQRLGAPAPSSMSVDIARGKLGDFVVYVYDEQSGASNRKAKEGLDWQPTIPSWELGFSDLAGGSSAAAPDSSAAVT